MAKTKIQHIRRDGTLIGTLVAIPAETEVRFGFSVVRPGDNPSKKMGVRIAFGRAVSRPHTKIPKKIEPEFREFVEFVSSAPYYNGLSIPKPDDFLYTMEPLK